MFKTKYLEKTDIESVLQIEIVGDSRHLLMLKWEPRELACYECPSVCVWDTSVHLVGTTSLCLLQQALGWVGWVTHIRVKSKPSSCLGWVSSWPKRSNLLFLICSSCRLGRNCFTTQNHSSLPSVSSWSAEPEGCVLQQFARNCLTAQGCRS